MADRPPRDLDWVPDNTTGINVPSQTKQNAGWLIEKPARQFFNWLANRQSRWTHYLSGQSQEFIVIDSTNTNEKDYATLAAYIADAPAAGDKVLVKETQVLTAQMIVPGGITLRLLDGVVFTRSTVEANSVIKFGSDIIIEGILNLVLSQTVTIAKAIEFDGDNVVGEINIENSSTGILTAAYHVNSAKTGNRINGFLSNTGGGTIGSSIANRSAEKSNRLVVVVDADSDIVRTDGLLSFPDALQWNFPSQVGSDLNIVGGVCGLARLNGTDVAWIESVNNDLRTYRFDGTNWTQVGNDLNIPGISRPTLTALNGTDVAFVDDFLDSLRTYSFDGTNWSQVGNSLAIAVVNEPSIAALNGTDIAYTDTTAAHDLRTYRFDGTDWAQVGNSLSTGTGTTPSITALNGTDVAFIDGTDEDLKTYRFDGTDWAQVGNALNIPGILEPSITALNETDIAFIEETSGDLKIYRFNQTDWVEVGNQLNISGVGGPRIAAMDGSHIAFYDGAGNDDLRLYKFDFAIGAPH